MGTIEKPPARSKPTKKRSSATASPRNPHLDIPYPKLLEPPIKRAAYSDRTAWIMALMSKLAYLRFEDSTPAQTALSDVLELITGEDDLTKQDKVNKIDRKFSKNKLLAILQDVAGATDRSTNYQELEESLDELNFTLVETFSIRIPLVVDTQAYLARLDVSGRDPFLVLAFRGTEAKKPTDIKTDMQAEPLILGALGGPAGSKYIPEGEVLSTAESLWPKVKVHPGFWEAFIVVKPDVERELNKRPNLPLYITGHSLGGALAVVATYALDGDRIAATYTFGGPRVGNLQFGQRIKSPVYRVINASDIVPRLPPGVLVDGVTILMKWLVFVPYSEEIANFLERFRGYRHYGDQRYLSASAETVDDKTNQTTFPNLIVRANPPQLLRWFWLCRRWVATYGKAAVQDHSIDVYVRKLLYWAYVRSST